MISLPFPHCFSFFFLGIAFLLKSIKFLLIVSILSAGLAGRGRPELLGTTREYPKTHPACPCRSIAPKRESERDQDLKIVFTPALWYDRPVPITPKRESERDQDLKIALTPALWRDRPVPIAPERRSERDVHVPIAPERGSERDRDWPVAPERESERNISAKSRQNARVNAILDCFW